MHFKILEINFSKDISGKNPAKCLAPEPEPGLDIEAGRFWIHPDIRSVPNLGSQCYISGFAVNRGAVNRGFTVAGIQKASGAFY